MARQLKVKQTEEMTQTKGSWTYSKVQIDLDKLKQLRVAIYDNNPDEATASVNGRYRAELQLWTDTDTTETKGDYKLVNKLSNWQNFRQNQYKKTDDEHAAWYREKVQFVKDYMLEHGKSRDTILACPLGARQNNCDGQSGFAHVPKMILLMHTDGADYSVRLLLDDIDHQMMLTESVPVGQGNDGRPAQCYYQRQELE